MVSDKFNDDCLYHRIFAQHLVFRTNFVVSGGCISFRQKLLTTIAVAIGGGGELDGCRGSDGRSSNSNNINTNYFTATDLTICYFTNCGRNIVVGTVDGTAFAFALEDMPFSPHRQYDALEEAIMRSLASKPELKRKIKQLGFLGY